MSLFVLHGIKSHAICDNTNSHECKYQVLLQDKQFKKEILLEVQIIIVSFQPKEVCDLNVEVDVVGSKSYPAEFVACKISCLEQLF